MAIFPSSAIPSGAAAADYSIPYSCRFNEPDDPYLSRTPAGASNRKTWTFSFWVKLGLVTGYRTILAVDDGSAQYAEIMFDGTSSPGRIYWHLGGTDNERFYTEAVYKDPSAWYHIVCVLDTTIASPSGTNLRAKMYVNGEQITEFSGANLQPDLDYEGNVNKATQHEIGARNGTHNHCDGYLAEVHFIDGTALTASSFGEAGDYGEWKAKEYSTADGAYGTNGYYLDFADAAALGDDAAGSNDWAVSNIVATDQMLDTPTNNFATLNPLWQDSSITLQEGNLRSSRNANMNRPSLSTINMGTGKWYFEALDQYTSGNQIGVQWEGTNVETYVHDSGTQAYTWNNAGGTYANGVYASGLNGGSVASGNNIRMVAYDGATGKLWGGANGTWGSSGDPAAGTNESMTVPAAYRDKMNGIVATENSTTSQGIIANFGQDSSFAGNKTAAGNQDDNSIGDFFYDVPAGFLALCTQNLPAVAVVPSDNFNTILYTGDGTSEPTGQPQTGVGFQPDFVWIKCRNGATDHFLFDAIRGVNQRIKSNSTDAEYDDNNSLLAFGSDGFTVADDAATGANTSTYVAWNWKGGNATSGTGDFTQGDIASTCSRNVDAGFSIVSWAGTGTAGGQTIGHGLSSAPEMIITKRRNDAGAWYTYSSGMTSYNYELYLNDTTPETAGGQFQYAAPTSSLFTVYGDGGLDTSGGTYIAYCFHSVDGYSKFGSYTGNANADGPFIYLGFRPKYFMIKASTTTDGWVIYDSARDSDGTAGFNKGTAKMRLFANNDAGGTEIGTLDFLSNGIKIRASGLAMNEAHTYIYMAFAESPFKYSNAF